MLPAGSRLRRPGDFGLALRRGPSRGQAARATVVVTVTRTHDAAAHPLVGFAVPRAVGGAVVRNRVRRRLRHLMAGRLADLPAASLTVVRALPSAAGAATLGRDLVEALGQAISRSGPVGHTSHGSQPGQAGRRP